MWRCFCKKKTVPTHEAMLRSIKEVFESDCIRLLCILENDGKVLSIFTREDITPLETDTLLQKVAGIKNQALKLSSLQGDRCGSLHIQGKHTSCSFYDLPDNNLLVFVADTNPLTSEKLHISETRALIHAKIGELFVKS